MKSRIIDITFGLSDYGDLQYLATLHRQYKQLLLEELRMEKDMKNEEKYKKKIDLLKTQIKKKLEEIEKWE